MLLTAPVLGEIALVAGIVLGAIGVVKSVWSWFSSDYKKSQQRKAVDKNLDKVCGIIEEKMRNKIENAKKGICEKVESLKARLNDEIQKRNQENLEKLLDFVKTGEKYGIEIEESFKAKINSAIQSATDQKLRVALVGGFSEGKTSIAATWIERLDKSMKIDHQESSDAVKIYDIDNEIELVDTPGLFGFKEK